MSWRIPHSFRSLTAGIALAIAVQSCAMPSANAASDNRSARSGATSYISRTFAVRNVDVAKFLAECRRWGLDIPLQARGKVTATITVHLPWRHLLTWGDYRLDVTLQSPALEVEGVDLRKVDIAASYGGGRLQIDQATFDFIDPESHAAAGHFHGTAALQVAPRGDLTSHLQVDGFTLETLRSLGLKLPEASGGKVSGSLQTRVPFKQLRQLSAWQAAGDVVLSGLEWGALPPLAGSAQFDLERGSLLLDELTAQLGTASLQARGNISSQAPYRYRVDVQNLNTDLANWQPYLPLWASSQRIGGRLRAAAVIQGQARPLTWSAAVTADISRLVVDWLHVDAIYMRLTADADRMLIDDLQATGYGGRASATGSVPLSNKTPTRLALQWDRVQLGRLAADATGLRIDGGRSQGHVDLAIPAGKQREVAAWQASGNASAEGVAVEGIAVRSMRGAFRLERQSLLVSPFQVTMSPGEVAAAVRVNLATWQAAANYVVRDLELSNFGSRLPAALQPLAGQLSLVGRAQADVVQRTLTTSGTGGIRRLSVHRLRLDAGEFGYAASQYGVRVANFIARAYRGRISASGTLPFGPRVAGAADVAWQDIDGGALAADLGWSGTPVTAVLGGAAQVQLPAGRRADLSALVGQVQLVASGITGLGLRDGRATLTAKIGEGVLSIASLGLEWPDGQVRGTGSVALSGALDFSVRLQASGLLPAIVRQGRAVLVSPVSGRFKLAASLSGSVRPLSLAGEGTASLRDVHVAGLVLDAVDFGFTADGPTLAIHDFNAWLYGGYLQGRAAVSLAGDRPSRARFTVEGIDVGKLARDGLRLPWVLEAPASGALDVDIPAHQLRNLRQWDIVANGRLPAIRVNHELLGTLSATADYRNGVWNSHAAGTLSGGALHVRAHWSPSAEATNGGFVELRGLDFARLAQAFPNNRLLARLAGSFDLSLPFVLPSPAGWPTGDGNFRVGDVAWQNTILSRQINGHIKLQPARLQLLDVGGDVAQGIVRGEAVFDLRHPQSRWFELSLSGASVKDLLVPWPEVGGSLSGRIDLRMRGLLARICRVDGTLLMSAGRAYGLEINDFVVPLRILADPFRQSAEVSVVGAAGDVAHGRSQIQATMHVGERMSVEAEVRFRDLNLQPLLAVAGNLGRMAAGRATGTLQLTGHDVQTLRDVSGNIDARLRNVRPTGLPVFAQIEPFLAGGLGRGFTEGRLRARLGGGVVTLQKLAMAGPSLQLYATGDVALSGSLDVDVMASNYSSPAGLLGPALLARLPLAATGPVGLLFSISEILSNRVIYLEVTGTVRSPLIHLRPLPTLTNEAARFFLGGGG